MYIKNFSHTSTLLEEIEGTVQGHRDGHGFLLRDDGQADIYLAPNEMRAVMHRDRVKVRVIRHDRRGRPEGRVVEIVERPDQPLIGRLLNEGGIWLVAPEDKRYGQDVMVPKSAIGQAKTGQVVVVELTEPPALYGQPVGRVKEVLGEMDDPGMEIEIAVRKYGVPHEFSDGCLAQARALPDQVRPADKKQRIDLTDVPLVTIDGEDARDFDDAVYCEPAVIAPEGKKTRSKKPNGWRLLVAIADVSHYVENGSAIDVDAYERATSVYFPRRVIPMLPEKLSNGLCSLNPAVERLCMVCDMLVTAAGDIHAYQFYPAVMFSHARLTYTEVAAILANTRGPEAAKRKAAGFDAVAHLVNLHDAYRALLAARNARGAVDFETTETQIICDEAGRIEKIVPRTRNDAHRLIEEAMLAANVCAADFILQGQHPGLYRVHEGPTNEKKDILRSYLKAMAVGLSIGDDPTPGEFQAIAEATKDRPDAQQIHTMLLRSMQQAIYSPHNSGHFGLAYEAYTHFTSPIRRYPDLLVHRVIKALLGEGRYTLPTLPTPGEAQARLAQRLQKGRAAQAAYASGNAGREPAAALSAPATAAARRGGPQVSALTHVRAPASQPRSKASPVELQAWEAAGLHCSANERRADEASRDVEAWLKCKYMKEHLGEEYSGVVTAATTFGLFVTLDALYVEGLVHITELGGEYYRFDEVRQELRGERTGIRYAIGTRVRVQVSRVDLDGRKIDFRLVRDGDEVALRALRDKGLLPASGNGLGHGGHASTASASLEPGRDDSASRRRAKAGDHTAEPPLRKGAGQQAPAGRRAASPAAAKAATRKNAPRRAGQSSGSKAAKATSKSASRTRR